MIALAALLLVAAPAAAMGSVAGPYELHQIKPNDLGKARFDAEPLQRDGADLVMERYDRSFRFVKVRP